MTERGKARQGKEASTAAAASRQVQEEEKLKKFKRRSFSPRRQILSKNHGDVSGIDNGNVVY